VRAVVDIDDLHPFVFKGQFVMRRLHLGRVLGQSGSKGKMPQVISANVLFLMV